MGLGSFGLECPQRLVALCYEAVAPALGIGENSFLMPIIGPKSCKQCMDGLRVDIAHEFANVLPLSTLRLVRLHSPGPGNGIG